jgi:tetratricopeptide (TPR) repeat protein
MVANHLWKSAADRGDPYAIAQVAIRRYRQHRWNVESAIKRAVSTNHPAAFLVVAEIRAEQGRTDEAERYISLAARSDNPQIIAAAALLMERQNRRQEADTLGARAMGALTVEAAPVVQKWLSLKLRHDIEPALTQLVDAGSSDALLDLAKVRIEEGDRASASSLARRAISAVEHPRVADVYAILIADYGIMSLDESYRLAADRGSAIAFAHLARMAEYRGNHAEAIAFYTSAVDTVAGRSEYFADHRLEEFTLQIEKGAPGSTDTFVAIAEKAGLSWAAKWTFERLMREDPKRGAAYAKYKLNSAVLSLEHLAHAWREMGRADDAENLLRYGVDAEGNLESVRTN